MATEDLTSTIITNATATPVVKAGSAEGGGALMSWCDVIEWTTGKTSGSTYRYGRVPSNARVHRILLYSDQFTSTGATDIGLYDIDGGAVVDADLFASAVDIHTAALNGSDVTHESASNPIDNADEKVWQRLGLSADPGILYDVVCTNTATNGSAGTVALKVEFVV